MRTLAFAFVFALFPPLAAAQSSWIVDPHGSAPGSGTAADPYPTIRAALENPSLQNGHTILVAPGTYEEGFLEVNSNVTLRSTHGALATILLNTTLKGLYAGTSTLDGFTVTGQSAGYAIQNVKNTRNSIFRDVTQPFHLNNGMTITNTTIVDCGTVFDQTGLGHMLQLTNCALWGNADVLSWAAEITLFGNVLRCAGQYPTGNAFQLTGNIPGDPLMWDAPNDVHLTPSSPLIGAGSAGLDIGALPFDPGYRPALHTYCVTTPNSAGAGAQIDSDGPASVSAADFVLNVTGAPPGQLGKFYYGAGKELAVFGDGYRCVDSGDSGLGTFRLPVGQVDAGGTWSYALDFSSAPVGSGPGAILSGATWRFQFWYRDPGGPGGTNFNLSDGLSVTFWP